LYEIPFVPILEKKRIEWSMFKDFLVKERVLKPVRFIDRDHLLKVLAADVIEPAETSCRGQAAQEAPFCFVPVSSGQPMPWSILVGLHDTTDSIPKRPRGTPKFAGPLLLGRNILAPPKNRGSEQFREAVACAAYQQLYSRLVLPPTRVGAALAQGWSRPGRRHVRQGAGEPTAR
jgi:hypothetical protein